MKRIGIIAPAGREGAMQAAGKAAAFLKKENREVFCESFLHDALPGTSLLRRGVSVDAVLALGGDGTILRAAPYAPEGTPVLGINLGSKGFLAAAEADEMEGALRALLEGSLPLETRPLLMADGNPALLALNEIALLRLGRQRLVAVRVRVNGEEVGCYRADGFLVSTPTGSTGYSLSAGGPIILPGTRCLLLIPVCAHCLETRPILVPDSSRIGLEVMDDPEQQADLQLDGRTVATLRARDRVTVGLSGQTLSLCTPPHRDFFAIVRKKLTEWSD